MKRFLPLITVLACLSMISGVLLSKMSFLARTAINVFKKEYQYYAFMKVWWQGALVIFIALMILLLIQVVMNNKMSKTKGTIAQIVCLAFAIVGLYFTYHNFRADLSHRWAGERLHLGFYLFWIGWGMISLFMIFTKSSKLVTDVDKRVSSNLQN
jgi:hypothetical protein